MPSVSGTDKCRREYCGHNRTDQHDGKGFHYDIPGIPGDPHGVKYCSDCACSGFLEPRSD